MMQTWRQELLRGAGGRVRSRERAGVSEFSQFATDWISIFDGRRLRHRPMDWRRSSEDEWIARQRLPASPDRRCDGLRINERVRYCGAGARLLEIYRAQEGGGRWKRVGRVGASEAVKIGSIQRGRGRKGAQARSRINHREERRRRTRPMLVERWTMKRRDTR